MYVCYSDSSSVFPYVYISYRVWWHEVSLYARSEISQVGWFRAKLHISGQSDVILTLCNLIKE